MALGTGDIFLHKGPFIKDVRTRGGEGVPKKQKNADMGEGGCLANSDVLFKVCD